MCVIVFGMVYMPRNKYIRSEWIDPALLSVMYLLSFVLFAITISDIDNVSICLLGIFILLMQLLWILSLSVFYKISTSVIFSTMSFLISVIMCQLIQGNKKIGVIPFMFMLLFQVLLSLDLHYYNNDIE